MARPRPKPVESTLKSPPELGAESIALEALLKGLVHNPREVLDPLVTSDQLAEEAELMGGSLRKFLPAAWRLIEPSPFIPNWHIDAICDHLEAVSNGSIKDLLITMPPRHGKSLVITTLWPVWEWVNLPFYRWVFASYAFSLSVRDSIKRRNVVKSKWYTDRWYDRFQLVAEQDTKIRFENDKRGFMLASSVGGTNTGEGGERIVADDPHNVKKSESEDVRLDTVNWWNITMSTRRNDDTISARIVVQQRVHEGDVAGDIIDRGGYVHLNLPTEFGFAGASRCFTQWVDKPTGQLRNWSDPRVEDGELLNPSRFSATQNEKAKIELGDYQYAAQHGQNPTPPQGQIIQAAWLKYYGGPTKVPIPDWAKATHPFTPLLSLDCSFKDHKDTDFVAGLGWAMFGADIYLMPTCIHSRLSFTATIDAVAEFVGGTTLDGTKTFEGTYPFIKIKLVEDKANGSAIIDTLQHRIPGMIPFEPGNSNKEARLQAGSWRFRSGNIYLPHESICPWIKEYVYELCAFPRARKDDYVDATSQMLLFIGGDATAGGVPATSEQESRWFALGESDMVPGQWGSGTGTPMRASKSVWRRNG